MVRRSIAALLTLVAVASSSPDILACGDKFLRVGRSSRYRNYASVYPSSILVYAAGWTRRGRVEFDLMLQRGGHKPVVVTTAAALAQALAADRYAVVIANYRDAEEVAARFDGIPQKPALLPLLYKPTREENARAAAAYGWVLKPEKMTRIQALAELDHLLGSRQKELAAAAPIR